MTVWPHTWTSIAVVCLYRREAWTTALYHGRSDSATMVSLPLFVLPRRLATVVLATMSWNSSSRRRYHEKTNFSTHRSSMACRLSVVVCSNNRCWNPKNVCGSIAGRSIVHVKLTARSSVSWEKAEKTLLLTHSCTVIKLIFSSF